jgi:hypothetical protein
MYATLALIPQELPLLLREYKAGMYSVHLYYTARMISLVSSMLRMRVSNRFQSIENSRDSELSDTWSAHRTGAVHRHNILAGGIASRN